MRSSKFFLLSAALALLVLSSGAIWAEGEQIVPRPLTPQEIHDLELPEGRWKSFLVPNS